MSNCTFLIIKGKRKVLRSAHYSEGHTLIRLRYSNPLTFGDSDLRWSDTKRNPAIVVNFNTKTVTSTKYNGFDDYEQDIQFGWRYINEEKYINTSTTKINKILLD